MALKPCPTCGLDSYDWDLEPHCARCRVKFRVAALFAPAPAETTVLGPAPIEGVREIPHDRPGDN